MLNDNRILASTLANDLATDLRVGDPLPILEFEVSAAQVFMYSAITWNRHQIHYNQTQARAEGHADIVVQRGLLGNLLVRYINSYFDNIYIETLSWKVVSSLTPGQVVQCTASVIDISGSGWQQALRLNLSLKHKERIISEASAAIRGRHRVDVLVPYNWGSEGV
jgi:hydroxyacyl-ACP dehydratase HTD2-like protein with hotdog domain